MSQRMVGYISYTTKEGDTFDMLALSAYDEERMATNIITANPEYCDVLIFDAGIDLRIPILQNAETPDSLPPWRRSS